MSDLRRLAIPGLAALVATVSPARAEPTVALVPLPFAVDEFRGPDTVVAAVAPSTDALRGAKAAGRGPLVVVWGPQGGAALALEGGGVRAFALGASVDLETVETGRGAIPAARLARSGPLTASLVEPTRAVPHASLGSPVHAAAISVAERRPVAAGPDPRPVPVETARVEAGPEAAFEAREVKIVAGRDGAPPRLLAIRSTADKGAALAILEKRDGAWRIAAETPPTGEPRTWLNLAAATATPDGLEIAIVLRPDRDGLLQLWSYKDGRLALVGERPGFSNHAAGRAAQDLAAIVETGSGERLLALPSLDRAALAFVRLRPDLAEVARVPLPAKAASGVGALGRGPDSHVLVGLEDGRLADVRL